MIKSSTKNIILIGMMGSGKSTTAKKIAEQTFLTHLDTDELISASHQKSIQDIFDAFGEKQFRDMENKVAKNLPKENHVISTGGGMPCYHENMDVLNKNGITFYLSSPVDLLFSRLKNKKNRPLFKNQLDQLELFLNERLVYYEKAHVTIDISDKNVDQVALEILDFVNL